MSRRLTRREALAALGAGLVAGASGRTASGLSRPGVVGVGRVEPGAPPGRLGDALAGAVCAATGADSATSALAALFSPVDTVGLKLSCLAGPRMSPRVELVERLVAMLGSAGVPGHRIIVFERSSRELERAGFTVRRSGGRYRCVGIDNDYDRQPSESGRIGSCFATLVSSTCSALISVGVVKDHDLAGVSAGLKNWYGVIHNPNKYHDSNCDPYVADVVRHPPLRDKLRLTVLDGVEAQCQGGPALNPPGLFELGAVAVSTDPVAVDLWAWQRIDEERRRRGLPLLEDEKRAPRFIATAARAGLGVADPARLEVVGA